MTLSFVYRSVIYMSFGEKCLLQAAIQFVLRVVLVLSWTCFVIYSSYESFNRHMVGAYFLIFRELPFYSVASVFDVCIVYLERKSLCLSLP